MDPKDRAGYEYVAAAEWLAGGKFDAVPSEQEAAKLIDAEIEKDRAESRKAATNLLRSKVRGELARAEGAERREAQKREWLAEQVRIAEKAWAALKVSRPDREKLKRHGIWSYLWVWKLPNNAGAYAFTSQERSRAAGRILADPIIGADEIGVPKAESLGKAISKGELLAIDPPLEQLEALLRERHGIVRERRQREAESAKRESAEEREQARYGVPVSG
jgi:hypothetical protein